MSQAPTVEALIESIPAETLRKEIAELKAKVRNRELLLALKEEGVQAEVSPAVPSATEERSGGDVPPTSRKGPVGEKPLRGAAAIRFVLEREPRSEWTPAEIRAALAHHGLEISADTVRVTMSRMYRNGEFTKPREGIYVPKVSEGTSGNPSTPFSFGGESNS